VTDEQKVKAGQSLEMRQSGIGDLGVIAEIQVLELRQPLEMG
jgi:hypothetical protein